VLRWRWTNWLTLFGAIVAATVLVAALLRFQGLVGSAWATGLIGGLFAAVWIALGLWRWREVRLVERAGHLVLGTVAAALLAGLCVSLGHRSGAVAVGGMWAMGMAFAVGLAVIRATLGRGGGAMSIATAMIEDAIRMKVALVFIALLLLLVAVLPSMLDVDQLMQERMKTFLTWSLTAVSVILSLLTILLACWSVSRDLVERQVYMTLTKPIGRGAYLLGKWLGVVVMNLLLLTVAGIGIYGFVLIMLHSGTQRDTEDLDVVRRQVLVARVSEEPRPPADMDFDALFEQRLAQLRDEFPGEYDTVTPQQANGIHAALVARWLTIGPGGAQQYLFSGLGQAKRYGDAVQLKLRPYATADPSDRVVYLAMRINRHLFDNPVLQLTHDQFRTLSVPADWIDDQGQLLVEIANLDDPRQPQTGSVTFMYEHALEVFYRVGDFGANLLRSLIIVWLRLAFLAMLGLTMATSLDFPVASLACLLIYVGASASVFFDESLQSFARVRLEDTLSEWQRLIGLLAMFWQRLTEGQIWDAMKVPIRLVGEFFLAFVPSFGRFNPTPLVAKGQVVSWELTGQAGLSLGVLWTGVCGLVGRWLMHHRELARVTV